MNEEENLNLDFSKRVIIEGELMPWIASPVVGVERKRFEREFAESGRATSMVRYLPGMSFSSHVHSAGEEFLVLEGVFSDSQGNYPEGSYVRNPPGSSHEPFSKEGCIIFVKLCQMSNSDQEQVSLNINELDRQVDLSIGHSRIEHREILLFQSESERVSVEELSADAGLIKVADKGGIELLILEGDLLIDNNSYSKHTWIRVPPRQNLSLLTNNRCKYWIKRGHLPLNENY